VLDFFGFSSSLNTRRRVGGEGGGGEDTQGSELHVRDKGDERKVGKQGTKLVVCTRGRARYYAPFLVCLASKKHRRKRRSICPCEHRGESLRSCSSSFRSPIKLALCLVERIQIDGEVTESLIIAVLLFP